MKIFFRSTLYIVLVLVAVTGQEAFSDWSHPHWWRVSGTIINTDFSFDENGDIACYAQGEVRVRSRLRNCGFSLEEDCPWGLPWGWGQSDSPDWGIIRLVDGQYQATTPWWGPPTNGTDREIQIQHRVPWLMSGPTPGPNDGWWEIALGFKGGHRSGDSVFPFGDANEFNSLIFDGESTQGIWRFRRSVRLRLGPNNCGGVLPGRRPVDEDEEEKPEKPPKPVAEERTDDSSGTTGKGIDQVHRQNIRSGSDTGLNSNWTTAVTVPSDLVRDFLHRRIKSQSSYVRRDAKIPPRTWELMERFGGTVFSEASSRPRKGRGTPPWSEEEFRPRPPILGPYGREYCDCGISVSTVMDITICADVGYIPCEECVCY
jgi:hypothetical protein